MRRYVFISHANDDKPRLKPLVEALLDTGIPLWIDRPEEIGLDDRHLQCGRIVAGADWQQEIRLALGRAACVLFVLSRVSNSFNRSDELYREFDFGKSQRMLVIVKIDPIAHNEINPFIRLLQAIDLSGALGGPEQSQAARAKFDVLVECLRDRLMADSRSLEWASMSSGYSALAAPSRESVYRPPRLLPYMCNRHEQQRRLTQVLQAQIDSKVNRALTFFAVGSEDECVDSFVEQLQYDEYDGLPQIMESNGLLGEVLFRSLQWLSAEAEEAFSQDGVMAQQWAEIENQVRRALGIKAAPSGTQLIKLIEQKLATAQVSCCLHISIGLDQWELGQRRLIQHWLRWWASMDLTRVSHPVITIVSVVYPSGRLQWFLCQRAIRRMQGDITTLAKDAHFGTAVHLLPALRSVRFEDVDRWIWKYVDDADREALRHRVGKQFSRTWSLRRRRLSMYKTAEVVKTALRDPNIRG